MKIRQGIYYIYNYANKNYMDTKRLQELAGIVSENLIPFDKDKVKVGDYVEIDKEVIDRPRFGIAKYAGYSATDDQVILKTDKGRMYVKSQYVKIKK